jgi:hypothetical protein
VGGEGLYGGVTQRRAANQAVREEMRAMAAGQADRETRQSAATRSEILSSSNTLNIES